MKYIITERQYRLLTEEPEEVLEIPFKFFNNDWNFLQEYLEMIGNPPYKIIGNLDLFRSKIESLGNLQSVGGDLDLSGSDIKSLGNLKHVGGDLFLYESKIKSFGNLQSIRGSLFLEFSKIQSLGNLESVGDDLSLYKTPLSKTTTEEEIRKQVEVGGGIFF